MTEAFNKFKRLLEELFQFDRADLDFGIYRIMNSKRDEVSDFLEYELLPQVKKAFEKYRAGDGEQKRERMAEIEQAAIRFNADPEQDEEYRQLKAELAESKSVAALEDEVYSDLYTFFRRYYKNGDFLSLRRYKADTYAIPYEGEEVKLHWANADQYYVKTTESFRDYRFRLPDGRYMHFRLAAASTERDNNKALNGKERRFVLREETPVEEAEGELNVYFEYGPHTDKQKTLNERTVAAVFDNAALDGWEDALRAPMPTDSNPGRTTLEKHLGDYTARNSFDYFIHKDLGRFLRRELDFYLKNEVLHVDDLDAENADRAVRYLSKLGVVKQIGHKIIAFLAQLEDFQKKLFEKKKFVVQTDYCLTLDIVPEEFYPEISANDAQYAEWETLFTISELPANLENGGTGGAQRSVQWLKANPHLVLDTKFFGQDFKYRLLSTIKNLDQKIDGLLVNSENLQALNLIQVRYRDQVKCTYIDPPYNTGSDGFLYKDAYQHASWLSMMNDRVAAAYPLLSVSGSLAVHVNDIEVWRLRGLVERVLGPQAYVVTVVTKSATPSSFKTVNLGPVDITEQIILAARDRGSYLYDTQYVDKRGVDLAHFSRFVVNQEDAPEDWEFRPIRKHIESTLDEEQLETLGKKERSLLIRTLSEQFALDNAERVFETKTLQKPSAWLRTHIEESRNREHVVSLNREGRPPVYLYKGRQIYFLANNILVTNGERRLVEPVSNLWLDIDTNNLRHEGDIEFSNGKKPLKLVQRFLSMSNSAQGTHILDFFAGSGTTGHAVINLNREDGANRKYILVEMGEYFDMVLKRRIQKVIYSKDWRDGKPVSREGSSHVFKYMKLESYEDTLNNVALSRSAAQQELVESDEAVREQYMLSYMLDNEASGSPSLLNSGAFEQPFSHRLKVSDGNETRPVNVDMVETFNYLLGLTVDRVGFEGGFRTVEGSNPQGERVLVIWRNLGEGSNADLDTFFERQGYDSREEEDALDLIYVNGDNNLDNLKGKGGHWRTLLIEEEFRRSMFGVSSLGDPGSLVGAS